MTLKQGCPRPGRLDPNNTAASTTQRISVSSFKLPYTGFKRRAALASQSPNSKLRPPAVCTVQRQRGWDHIGDSPRQAPRTSRERPRSLRDAPQRCFYKLWPPAAYTKRARNSWDHIGDSPQQAPRTSKRRPRNMQGTPNGLNYELWFPIAYTTHARGDWHHIGGSLQQAPGSQGLRPRGLRELRIVVVSGTAHTPARNARRSTDGAVRNEF